MGILRIDWDRMPHRERFSQLFERFKELGRVLIAYSGGVDSTLLMKVGTMALGKDCIGVTARSETLTDDEYYRAQAIAGDHCFTILSIQYSELDIKHYAENPANRCYFCKHEMFSRMNELADELGVNAIIEGTNAEDESDWRPGMRAAEELQVVSPLREAGMNKDMVREMARALGLPNWDKPSSPCLSSRVAYGVRIDQDKLRQVAEGEKWLRERGFRDVRVRHHGELARVEVGAGEMDRLLERELREALAHHLLDLGFRHVTLDLQGYRRGSLNEGVVRPAQQEAQRPV